MTAQRAVLRQVVHPMAFLLQAVQQQDAGPQALPWAAVRLRVSVRLVVARVLNHRGPPNESARRGLSEHHLREKPDEVEAVERQPVAIPQLALLRRLDLLQEAAVEPAHPSQDLA